MWIKDPKTGKKSVTLTILMTTFVVAITKLALSGFAVNAALTFEKFSGADFASVIAAVGGIYGFRKFTDKSKDEQPPTDT